MFIQATYWTSASAFRSWMLDVTYVSWNIFKTLSVHNLSEFVSFTKLPSGIGALYATFSEAPGWFRFSWQYLYFVTCTLHLESHWRNYTTPKGSWICSKYIVRRSLPLPTTISAYSVFYGTWLCIRWEHKNSSGWADHSNHVAPIFVTSTACRSKLLLAFCLVIFNTDTQTYVDRTWS